MIQLKKERNRYGRFNVVCYCDGERYAIDFASKGYDEMIGDFFEYVEAYHTQTDIARCKEAERFFTARYKEAFFLE